MVEGPAFCVSGTSGDMEAEVPQGPFFRDVRVVSDWQIRVDGHRPHHLTVLSHDPTAPRSPSASRRTVRRANSCRNVGATPARGCARTSGCASSDASDADPDSA
ncbi:MULTISPECIES: glycogen debranching N-terminal domain-containing protein [unclassified Streptomyces]|uniref:glycogen debranching N-terminal domain-containing protein n=1 Tax=unclassified Streptomyces TaxID=2593676 RepID=UPI00331B760D